MSSPKQGIEATVIDPRTIRPYDVDAVASSVQARRTGS